ncbi:MAG: hypothetical protein ACP5OG_00815, partial [Candidatus Nanoarchaeia archaeon]
MNLIFHIIINSLFGYALNLNNFEIFILILGGVFIDIDHLIFQYFVIKNKTLKQIYSWHKKEYKIKRMHYFPFHFLEILVIIAGLFYFINKYLSLFFIGFALHILTDLVEHIIFHRNLSPLKYYTLIGRIAKNK